MRNTHYKPENNNSISLSNSLGSLLNTSLLRCEAEEIARKNLNTYLLDNNPSTSVSTNTLNCHSPSLLSLQRSLNHAYKNPEKHTQNELIDLETRQQLSIESLSRKAAERLIDLDAVCYEIKNIDQIRCEIFKTLSCNVEADSLLSRLRIHIVEVKNLSIKNLYFLSKINAVL